MSLTSKIKNDEEFNNILDIFNYDELLNEINNYNYKDLKIERKLSNIHLYAFLGTTFDYMCRFILQKFQYKYFNMKVDDIYNLVARHGYDRLKIDGIELIEKYNINYGKIIDFIYNNYVYNNEVKIYNYSNILPYAYNLSKLEEIYRCGDLNEFKVSIRFPMGRDSKWILEDLLNLFIENFDNKYKLRENKVEIFYNPNFGKYSEHVGGADADIIIDDSLIDFKTTRCINYNNKEINSLKQLIGYYLLNYLNNGLRINSLVLYYARYGVFIEKKLSPIEKDTLKIMSEKLERYFTKEGINTLRKTIEFVMNDNNYKIIDSKQNRHSKYNLKESV